MVLYTTALLKGLSIGNFNKIVLKTSRAFLNVRAKSYKLKLVPIENQY